MRVLIQERARKELRKLDPGTAEKILKKIASLESFPELPNIKRLKNFYPPFRMRVGEYRVLFDVEDEQLIVVSVRHRKEAYR